MAHITTAQVSELLSLDLRGPGLRNELQELIRRVTSGGIAGKSDDVRTAQAKKLWDAGFGTALKIDSFNAYLATIPSVPASLVADNPTFPLLILVDPRLGHVKSARLVGLKFAEYGNTDETLVPFDARHGMSANAPYWVRTHDGSPNLNKKPSDVRASLTGNQLAGTADVGIAIWLQLGKRNHIMDLPGSVRASGRGFCAYLDVWSDGPELSSGGDDGASPGFGSVVFFRE